jgi:hypothetical protein
MLNRIGRLLVVAGLLLFAVAVWGGLYAQEPPVIQVPAGQLIQQAINNAPEGAIIEVAEGTFAETLTISKPLTLKGAGPDKTILDGSVGVSRQRPTIRVKDTEKVTITGFTIQKGRRNIEVDNASNVIVANNVIKEGVRQNILYNNGASGEIRENEILDAKLEAPGLGRGINVVNSEVKILKNKIARSAAFGIILFASTAEIRENVLEDNVLDSIILIDVDGQPSDAVIVGNTIMGTKPDEQGRFGRGIEIILSRAVIANNTISQNAQFGIAAFGSGGEEGAPPLEIRDNTISENGLWGVALFFEEDFGLPSKAVLIGNTISGNAGVGVVAFEGSTALAVNNRVTGQVGSSREGGGDGDGFAFVDGGKGELAFNTIENNQGCGVSGAEVTGGSNILQNNSAGDLCDGAPESLKQPAITVQQTVSASSPDFAASEQKVKDAITAGTVKPVGEFTASADFKIGDDTVPAGAYLVLFGEVEGTKLIVIRAKDTEAIVGIITIDSKLSAELTPLAVTPFVLTLLGLR